jgi:hypothetical protein
LAGSARVTSVDEKFRFYALALKKILALGVDTATQSSLAFIPILAIPERDGTP